MAAFVNIVFQNCILVKAKSVVYTEGCCKTICMQTQHGLCKTWDSAFCGMSFTSSSAG